MDQITRISRMEHNLNEVADAIQALSSAAERYTHIQAQLQELSDYYGSTQWFRDYDDDCAGKLPKDLPRGVLSEDAICNILSDHASVIAMLKKILESEQTREGNHREL